MGRRIQASFDRKQEATLSLFVAVLLVVVLWMACHGEKFLHLGQRLSLRLATKHYLVATVRYRWGSIAEQSAVLFPFPN
jgi:hypothetical protein